MASKVRVAILDDYANVAAPKFSDLSSKIEVETFNDTFNVRDSAQKEAQIKRLQPFTIISTMRERTAFPRDVVEKLPNLKLLLTTGMKNASIDMEACAERGIIVAGAKGIGKAGPTAKAPSSLDSTMEHGWALILGICRSIAQDDAEVKAGGWQSSLAFGLKDKTLGVLGLGKLGADTARVAVLAFGMKILAWSSSLTQSIADGKAKSYGLPEGTFKVASSKEELMKESDVFSIHYVLSERSRGMVGEKELALMKPTAVFVNTSRGPLVDEAALLSTLKQGKIRGAALDVFDTEPLPPDSEWRTTKWGRKHGTAEVLLSPHMGYVEEGAMHRWYEDQASFTEMWLDGKDVPTRIN